MEKGSKEKLTGHLIALMTIIVWGTTFISSKVLLKSFTPLEIMLTRFSLGALALFIIRPRRLRLHERRHEWLFVGAGLCGVTLYFLGENIALTMTAAANVSVIVAVAPFFTAVLAHFFLKREKFSPLFFVGFALAIAGVAVISFAGEGGVNLNPAGDLLALMAAIVWAVYSVISRRISELGYETVPATRRTFLWGLALMLPTLFFLPWSLDLSRFASLPVVLNFLFLGICASALGYVCWGVAVRRLGAVSTSVYIYLIPVVTVITGALILGERLTLPAAIGTVLTLAGLLISLIKPRKASSEEK